MVLEYIEIKLTTYTLEDLFIIMFTIGL